MNPFVKKRRSVEYTARRSGSQEENVRRSGDYKAVERKGRSRSSVDFEPPPPAAEGPPRSRRPSSAGRRRSVSAGVPRLVALVCVL
jgi:hypothetical protein